MQYLPGGRAIPTTQNPSWFVDVGGMFDLKQGNMFFDIVFEQGMQEQLESHYFNITGPADNATFSAAMSSLSANATTAPRTKSSSITTSMALYTPLAPTAFATSQVTTTASSSTTAAASPTQTSSSEVAVRAIVLRKCLRYLWASLRWQSAVCRLCNASTFGAGCSLLRAQNCHIKARSRIQMCNEHSGILGCQVNDVDRSRKSRFPHVKRLVLQMLRPLAGCTCACVRAFRFLNL